MVWLPPLSRVRSAAPGFSCRGRSGSLPIVCASLTNLSRIDRGERMRYRAGLMDFGAAAHGAVATRGVDSRVFAIGTRDLGLLDNTLDMGLAAVRRVREKEPVSAMPERAPR